MSTTLATPTTGMDFGEGAKACQWAVDTYHRAGDAGVFRHDVKLELIRGRIIDRFTEAGPEECRWASDQFDQACNAGVFGPDARLELIHGRIMNRMGGGALHSILVTLIAERLCAALTPRFLVREEKPVRIAFDGEPVLDIMVVRGLLLADFGHYVTHQLAPQDVLLAVEVAVSSRDSDTGEKALLYAQAGIADYWVVLPEAGVVVVHREPTVNGYMQVTPAGENEMVTPLTAPEATLPVRELLGR